MEDTFKAEKARNIARLGAADDLRAMSVQWITAVSRLRYSYHFSWLGLPIIQFPPDIVAIQELIWRTRPDVVIETGVARGGSLILHASILELIGGPGRVIGVDIDIRPHNRAAIESHPLAKRIHLIQGSSIDSAVVEEVRRQAAGARSVLVILDSNHTHEHVAAELRAYQGLVKRGGYLVVFDTIIEDLPTDFFPDRPWGPGNNPRTAVREFLRENDRFEVDPEFEGKLLITVAPEGYLRCIRD